MSIAKLCHNMTSVSTYRPLTVDLSLCHSFEIAEPTLNPTEIHNLSFASIREADFSALLELEISCVIGHFRVAADRLSRFPFVSDVLKQLRETSHAAGSISRVEGVDDVDDSLILYHMILEHGSTPRKKPNICLRKIAVELTVSRAIHDLARGINALDMYGMLETNPPLPLQMCFDNLIEQLFSHLTEYFPALFGAHSTPLQKNAQFLSSSIDSMLRIMDASANAKRKEKAGLAYQRLVDNARSRRGIASERVYARALDGSCGDSGSAIKNTIAPTVDWDREDLVRSVTRQMYCARMKLLPQVKRQGTPVAVPGTEEVVAEAHDNTPEATTEDHALIENTEFCDGLDVNGRFCRNDREMNSSRPSSPAESILEMDSPPTSPSIPPFNIQEPVDTKLLTRSVCSSFNRVNETQALDDILEFSDDGV
ncbi:hypothetical protein FRC07_001076 [Ceratobasidium sp. 392]|nr:hypothetical protein FRC07_001076 [Ceratobasidium sp. 392]